MALALQHFLSGNTMKSIAVAMLLFATAPVLCADLTSDQKMSAVLDHSAESRKTDHLEIRFAPGMLSARQMNRFAALAEHGVRDIGQFIDVPVPPRVDIYVVADDIVSHTFPRWPSSADHAPRLFLSTERVGHRSAPYLHELVHAVVGEGGAMWLEEGYASWVASEVASRYGGYYAPVLSATNAYVDAQAAAIVRNEPSAELTKQLNWMRSGSAPSFAFDEERTSFYILAHSFTKYLANRVGVRTLTAIHRADNVEAIAEKSGKPIAEWKREWLETVGKNR